MSNPMMPGKPPMPGGPMPGNPIQENKSMFNPADASLMKQSGEIAEGMTVRDFLSGMGIDVDGPIDQLYQAGGPMAKQMENKGGISKMQNIAQGAGPSPAPAGPPMGQPEMPSMDNLLQGM